MTGREQLGRTAEDLKARYGDLLKPPARAQGTHLAELRRRLDEACARAGRPAREVVEQLSFDLRRFFGTTGGRTAASTDPQVCERHPDRPWPHDDCPGPGMPRPTAGR